MANGFGWEAGDRDDARRHWQEQRIAALEDRLFRFQLAVIWVAAIVIYALILATGIIAAQL